MTVRFHNITVAEPRRGELGKHILRLIDAGVRVDSEVVPPNVSQLLAYFNPQGRDERNRIWKALKYLEDRGRIRFENRGNIQYLHLTTEGKVELREILLWEMSITRPRRWDGKWRLVMFDFPVSHEAVRRLFKAKLEDFGFKVYQKSVFVYPHECRDEVAALILWCDAATYVRFIVADTIDDAETYMRLFDL